MECLNSRQVQRPTLQHPPRILRSRNERLFHVRANRLAGMNWDSITVNGITFSKPLVYLILSGGCAPFTLILIAAAVAMLLAIRRRKEE